MRSFKKIVGFNLLVLLVYSLIIRFLSSGSTSKPNYDAMGILIFSAFAVGLHVLISFLVALAHFSSRDREAGREAGRAWLATSGIVLLVGFSVCLGNAAL